jgi:hypothetical protein
MIIFEAKCFYPKGEYRVGLFTDVEVAKEKCKNDEFEHIDWSYDEYETEWTGRSTRFGTSYVYTIREVEVQ